MRKLVLFNAHGGQTGVMDMVARDLRARLGMLVYSVNWYGLPLVGAQGEDVNALFSASSTSSMMPRWSARSLNWCLMSTR